MPFELNEQLASGEELTVSILTSQFCSSICESLGHEFKLFTQTCENAVSSFFFFFCANVCSFED